MAHILLPNINWNFKWLKHSRNPWMKFDIITESVGILGLKISISWIQFAEWKLWFVFWIVILSLTVCSSMSMAASLLSHFSLRLDLDRLRRLPQRMSKSHLWLMVADSSYRCLETKISLKKGESFNPCFSRSRTRRGIWPQSSALSRSGRDPREPLLCMTNTSWYPK